MKKKTQYLCAQLCFNIAIATTLFALLGCQLEANAAANKGNTVEGAGNSTNSTVTGDLKPGDPLVSAFGDAWEVTLYVKEHQGSYLLWGNRTYAQRQLEGRLNLDIGNKYVADKNEVVPLGELVHIYHFAASETSNGSILTVKMRNEHRIIFPKVTVFRQQHEIAKQMTVGELIAVAGMIQTSRTDGEHRAIYRESIVGTDLDWCHAENL